VVVLDPVWKLIIGLESEQVHLRPGEESNCSEPLE
jgi:hypothetical protein